LAKPTQPYGKGALSLTLSYIVILLGMSREAMKEHEEFEAQFDLTTIQGKMDYWEALNVKRNEKKIEELQDQMMRDHQVSKEDWNNTTYSVKMAIIWLMEEANAKYEIEENVRNWVEDCPI
tara:strand:+ start:1212 stop:1574 length:363 start_codon:yes stop_codon:yes gene_type:complete